MYVGPLHGDTISVTFVACVRLWKEATSNAMRFQTIAWCFIREPSSNPNMPCSVTWQWYCFWGSLLHDYERKMDEKPWGVYSAWSVLKGKKHIHTGKRTCTQVPWLHMLLHRCVCKAAHAAMRKNPDWVCGLLFMFTLGALGAQNPDLEGNQGLQHCCFWITLSLAATDFRHLRQQCNSWCSIHYKQLI